MDPWVETYDHPFSFHSLIMSSGFGLQPDRKVKRKKKKND